MRTTIIVIILLVIGAGIAYYLYRRSVSKTSGGETDNGTNSNNAPNVTAANEQLVILGLNSTLVNSSDISSAPSPLGDLTTGITSSAITIKPLIHYVSGNVTSNVSCSQYVWYKNGYYTLIGKKTDKQGNQTCYYKFDKSILPSTIKIKTMKTSQCDYNKYLSGEKYTWVKDEAIPSGPLSSNPYKNCVYTKQ